MKKLLSFVFACACATTVVAADLPAVPDHASLLTEVKLEEKGAYTISTHWVEKGITHVFDVGVNSSQTGKEIYSLRLITFGENSSEWSWGTEPSSDAKPFASKETAWLKHATNLFNRFVVSGEFVADKVPWKFVGRVERLQSYETPYQLLFERNGRYLVLEYHEWLGDEPKKGESVVMAEHTETSREYHFAVTISSKGEISIPIGAMNGIAERKKWDSEMEALAQKK